MNRPDDQEERNVMFKLQGSLFMLTFGLLVLAFLIVIDRSEWFNLRPASGTAAAMAKASKPAISRNAGNVQP